MARRYRVCCRRERLFILDNDLRVFASRSRCKNSVGLNAVGAAGSAAAYGLFRWDWRLGRGGGEQVEACGRRRGRHCGVRDGGCVRQPSFRAHKPEDWRRRAKCVRGMPDACKDDLELVSGEGVGGSWSLGPLRGNLADKQEKAFAAARTDPRTIRLFRVGGFRAHWGLSRCRLRVEAKQ
jgi:hypothetical protein